MNRLSLANYLQLTKYYSLNEVVKYSYFVDRMSKGNRVSLSELNYKVLQAYDFKYLHDNYGVRGQLGGSDQRNNIADALRLIDDENYGLLISLLTNKDGTKYSKSGSGPQPFLSPNICNHLDFYRCLKNSVNFQILYEYLNYPNFDNLLISIMNKRGLKIRSLNSFERRS